VKEMNFSNDEFERYRLHPGDILLNEGQTPELLGRPAMYRGIPEEVAFTNSLIRFRSGPKVDPRWALLVFRRHMHFGRFTRESRITTNIAHLSAARFKTVEFPVPPIEEQRRIVDILEDHLSRLDGGVQQLHLATNKAQSLLRVEANSLVLGTNREAGHYRVVSVDELVGSARHGVVIGPFGSDLKTSDYREEGIPLIFVRNVRSSYFGPEGRRHVSLSKAQELVAHNVRAGDVLITKMGEPPGDAAVYDGEGDGIVTADVIRLRPSEGFLSEFIMWAMRTPLVKAQIREITRGVAQKKVSLSRFRSEVRLPAPDLPAQREIIDRLRERSVSTARLEQASTLACKRAERLRRALLSAAFFGQLTRERNLRQMEEMADV